MSAQKNITLEGAIAVTRFGLGAQQGEIALASQNPKAWLKDQLTETVLPFPMKGLLTSQGYILEKEALSDARKAEKSDEASSWSLNLSINASELGMKQSKWPGFVTVFIRKRHFMNG